MKIWSLLCGFCVAVVFSATANAVLITFDNIDATVVSEVPNPSPPPGSSGFTAVRTGEHTELILRAAGIVVTITRQTSKTFDIADNDGLFPGADPPDNVFLLSQQGKSAAFGKRSIDPFFDQSLNGFIFSFYESAGFDVESDSNIPLTITGFRVLAGDYGSDRDDMSLEAYPGVDLGGTKRTGAGGVNSFNMLGNTTRAWTQQRLSITHASGFSSLLFKSQSFTTTPTLSVFLDRIEFIRGDDSFLSDEEYLNSTGDNATVVIPEPATLALLAAGATIILTTRRRRIA